MGQPTSPQTHERGESLTTDPHSHANPNNKELSQPLRHLSFETQPSNLPPGSTLAMGNICGKEEPDTSPPGRVLGSAPAAQRKSTVPRKVGGPPRTLGTGPGTGIGPGEATTSPGDAGDARRKAAEAAEVRTCRTYIYPPASLSSSETNKRRQARAKASSKPGGKLQSQLSAQKRQSRADTLKQASAEEQRRREIANNEATTYN